MAMIPCHECRSEVSSEAVTCPGCGAPVRQLERSTMAHVVVIVGTVALLGFLAVGLLKQREITPAAAPVAAASPAPQAAPAPVDRAAADARLESCRAKLKQAQEIDLLTNMTFEGGKPKVWVGRTWNDIPVDAKEGFAEVAACFFVAGDEGRTITFPIYDGRSGKQIATWRFTRLEVE